MKVTAGVVVYGALVFFGLALMQTAKSPQEDCESADALAPSVRP